MPSFDYTQFKAIILAVNTSYIFQNYFQLKFFFLNQFNRMIWIAENFQKKCFLKYLLIEFPNYSSSAGGVIWSLCREVFLRDFYFHLVSSAFVKEKNYISSFSSNVGKVVKNTHTHTHTLTHSNTHAHTDLNIEYRPNIWPVLKIVSISIGVVRERV